MMAKEPSDRPEGILEAIDQLAEAAQAAGIATTGGTLSRRSSDDVAPSIARVGGGSGRHSSSGSRRPPSPSGSDGSRSSGSSTSKRAAPATSTAGLATSDTMVDPNLRVSAPGSGRSKQIGIGVLAVALLGGAFLAQRSLSATPTPSTPSSAPATSTSVQADPPKTAEPTVSAAPAASPAVVAPAPTTVKLRIKAAPPDADVYLGDKKLGAVSETLELPIGKDPVKLQIRRNGFVPQTREVTPTEDVSLENVKLAPVPAAAKPPVEF